MAIDRNIISFENGQLSKKSYLTILNMLINNISAISGERADVSIESTLGQEIRFNAQLFDNFANVIQDIYNTFDLTSAQGRLLDILMLLSSGLTRNKNTYSRVKITVEIPSNITITSGMLTQQWAVRTEDGVRWFTPQNVTVVDKTNSQYELELTCDLLGEYEIISNTSFIELRISGQFITDDVVLVGLPTMISYGSTQESDDQFKARAKNMFAFGSKTLGESIQSILLNNYPNVVKDTLVLNSNGETDLTIDMLTEDGLKEVIIPIHDILVVVQPLANVNIDNIVNGRKIALSLQETIPAGIRTHIKNGNLATVDSYLSFNDLPAGNYISILETLRFKVATRYNPDITIRLKSISVGDTAKPIIEQEIKNKIVNLSTEYLINQTIDVTKVRAMATDNSIPNRYTLDDSGGDPAVEITSLLGGTETNYGYWSASLGSDPTDTNFIFEWT